MSRRRTSYYNYIPELSEEDLDDMIREDTSWVCPEACITYDCPHSAITSDSRKKGQTPVGNVDFEGGFASRYFEDADFARAYCLYPYDYGIAVICDKRENYDRITIITLGEDDGSWFCCESSLHSPTWFTNKTNFMALTTGALAIFNANYKGR